MSELQLSGVLDVDAFASLLGVSCDDIEGACGGTIAEYDFCYETLCSKRFEAIVLEVLKALDQRDFKASGKERKSDWERGWRENLDAFVASGYDIQALLPKYIAKREVCRLFSHYVTPRDKMFELNFYTVYRHFLFKTYLQPYQSVFEFGAGTGYNLALMHQLFPEKRIVGLDWAESSVAIANALGATLNGDISGRMFDYFQPDQELEMPPDSALITLNSLEQLGGDYGQFLEFILDKRPAICINAEPFVEMYDASDLVDYLAIKYHQKRNYLNGYYRDLKRLESEGRIQILKEQRVPFGSLFHEGYSLMVWSVRG